MLENMSFAMLHHPRKPKFLWDYAFDWAQYILDRCPRRSNAHTNSITPFEAFFGQKPDLKDILIFGCLCFALVHHSEHALDGAKKFIVARSVVFYEQSLVDAMRIDIGQEVSDTSHFFFLPANRQTHQFFGDAATHNFRKQRSTPVNRA